MENTRASKCRTGTGVRARVRLGVVTLLVAMLPVAVAAWFVAGSLGGRERNRADAALQASLRSARSELASSFSAADGEARRLAARPAVQAAILRASPKAARSIARSSPRAVLTAQGRVLVEPAADHRVVRWVS